MGQLYRFRLIFIGGKRFRVGQNLFDFLKYAQSHRPNQNLWIDAICIDQANVQERNHQVQIMGQIFRHAASVLMFLNSSPRHILKMAEVLHQDPDEVFGKRVEQIYGVIRAVDAGVTYVKGGVEYLSSEILELCTNEYWNRLWVMQEILLANKSSSRVICGDYKLPWSDFSRFIFRSSPATMLPDKRARYEKSRLRQLVRDDGYARGYTCDSNELHDIKSALRMSRGTSCFDVRDRVFGILAIVRLGSSYAVDYNMNPVEVFYKSLVHFAND